MVDGGVPPYTGMSSHPRATWAILRSEETERIWKGRGKQDLSHLCLFLLTAICGLRCQLWETTKPETDKIRSEFVQPFFSYSFCEPRKPSPFFVPSVFPWGCQSPGNRTVLRDVMRIYGILGERRQRWRRRQQQQGDWYSGRHTVGGKNARILKRPLHNRPHGRPLILKRASTASAVMPGPGEGTPGSRELANTCSPTCLTPLAALSFGQQWTRRPHPINQERTV